MEGLQPNERSLYLLKSDEWRVKSDENSLKMSSLRKAANPNRFRQCDGNEPLRQRNSRHLSLLTCHFQDFRSRLKINRRLLLSSPPGHQPTKIYSDRLLLAFSLEIEPGRLQYVA